MLKKLLLLFVPIFAIAAIPYHQDNDSIFGGYIYPKFSAAQSIGNSTHRWNIWAQKLQMPFSAGTLYMDGSSTTQVDTSLTATIRSYLYNITSDVQAQLNASLSAGLSTGAVLIGNGSSLARAQFFSGAFTNDKDGIATLGSGIVANANVASGASIAYSKLNLNNALQASDFQSNSIANSKLAQAGASTVKGNNTTSTANVADLTTTQMAAMLRYITDISGDVAASGPGSTTATIQPGVITDAKVASGASIAYSKLNLNNALQASDFQSNSLANAKLAQAGASTLKGNNTTGTANVADLTATQVASMLRYITDLSGDGVASGPGSTTFTLVTVNSNVGTFTNPSITVNGKGLVTAISSGAGGGTTAIGTIDSQAKSSNGAVISGANLYMQTADLNFPGAVSTGQQDFAGQKRFNQEMLFKEIAAPSNPPSGYVALYATSAHSLYSLTSAGQSTQLGGSSSGGGGSGTLFAAVGTCGKGSADASTKVLLPFDTATVQDYSPSPITGWTLINSATIDSSVKVFGASSLKCVGNGGARNSVSPALGSGDFTYEFQGTAASAVTSDGWVETGTGTGQFEFWYDNGHNLIFRIAGSAIVTAPYTMPDTNPHHYEIDRTGTTVIVFADGVSVGSGTSSASISATSQIDIGIAHGLSLTGWIDEFRISNVARHTANFTPPAAAYAITNTINSNPGSWISSISGGGVTGVCTVNFTGGTFSSAPSCVCDPVTSTSGEATCRPTADATTSSVGLQVRVGGADADNKMNIHCQ